MAHTLLVGSWKAEHYFDYLNSWISPLFSDYFVAHVYVIDYFPVGVLYGTNNVMVGHPFDTLKTKMQAGKGFENLSMFRTLTSTLKQQGIVGLYR